MIDIEQTRHVQKISIESVLSNTSRTATSKHSRRVYCSTMSPVDGQRSDEDENVDDIDYNDFSSEDIERMEHCHCHCHCHYRYPTPFVYA
jgi:hypothetical protein